MALNIKLKDTQGISNRKFLPTVTIKGGKDVSAPVQEKTLTPAQEATLYYWGTVRGSGNETASARSNYNSSRMDRGVKQMTPWWYTTATPKDKREDFKPFILSSEGKDYVNSWEQSNKQRQNNKPLSITDQIKKNNAGIIGAEPPVAPTEQWDVGNIPEAKWLDDMYTGVFGTRKPTKNESMLAAIEEKKREQEDRLQAEKDNLSIIEQAEYLKKQKEQRQYLQEQENIRREQERIAEEQIGIQEEQQFKEASDSISRLRQNLGFLWGSNSVSQQALDSAGRQIASANTLYAEMKHLSELSGRARGNQSEALKKQFDWDLKLLQDDLDSKVDKTIQQAFDGITAADMAGQLDTVEEVNAMRLKVLNALDADVAAITKGEIQRRQSLLDQYTDLLKDEKERIEKSNTVNADMSAMMWYYVDGNGQPFIDANGAMIPTPIDPPFPPQFLKETGQLLTFWYDEAGNVVANIQQLIDMPTPASDKTVTIQDENGNNVTYQFNEQTGKYDIRVGNQQTWQADAWVTPSDFITRWEWFRDKAYWDVNWWAIGYWQHAINWVPVKEWDTIDRATADADLANRMTNARYNSLVEVDLSDYQKAALYSLEHNVGSGVWDFPNGKAIIDAINNGDLQEASNILATSWIGTTNAATGDVMSGLVNRRREEAELLMIPKDFDLWTEGAGDTGVVIDSSDINRFNDNTFNPSKDLKGKKDKLKYDEFLKAKEQVFNSKDASIQDILKYSAGSKEMDASAITRIDKFATVMWQIDAIQKQIDDMDTWPVIWRLRNINPYDTDAQTLKAQLQSLIPNLARGVYGEVGVLTDNDIRNYAQTIPNLTQTKDVQKAILAMTLDTLAAWYKNQLQALAAAKRDVSWFAWLYESIKWQADSLRSEIGNWQQSIESEMQTLRDSL